MNNIIIFLPQVVITGALNYSSPQVQSDLELILQRFENSTFVDPSYTESWLRDFLDFVRRSEEYEPIDISDEKKFITELTEVGKENCVSRVRLHVSDSMYESAYDFKKYLHSNQ
jgi:hypothetical protein